MLAYIIYYYYDHEMLAVVCIVYPWAHSPLVPNVPSIPNGEFPGYWDWLAQVSWATACNVLVSVAFSHFTFHISLFFHSLFFTCHWISFVFLLYDRRTCICTHSIDPSLADGEFPGLGLALVPDVVVSEDGVRMKQKSRFKFQPWPGFELRTLQYNGRERYY